MGSIATDGGAGEMGRRGSMRPSSNPQSKKPSLSSSSSFSNSHRAVRNNPKHTISPNVSEPSPSRIPRRSNTFNNSTTTIPKPAASVNRRWSLDKPPSSTDPHRGPNNSTRATSSTAPKKPAPQRSFSTLSASRSTKLPAPTPPIRRSLSTKLSPSSVSVRKVVKKTAPKSVNKEPVVVDEHEMPGLEDHLDDHVLGGSHDEHQILPDNLDNPSTTSLEQNVESPDIEDIDQEKELTMVEEKHVVVELEGRKEGEKESKGAEELVETESHETQTGSKREVRDYNDVIEETKNKLMEGRRNRVLALAGAFETVISLDSK